ncbi:hypothetical protein Tco_0261980 [Tanacetum coccineum]
MFTRSVVIQRRVEDLQLGVKSYQKKLNLTKPDTYRSDLKRREAYTTYSNPRGFIYQNKDKKNRLMPIDKLHKFSDGTLNDVQTALDDRVKRIRIKYLPQTIWKQSDRDKAGSMIQAIDKQLKIRRIMWSLEKFVGGRPYEVMDLVTLSLATQGLSTDSCFISHGDYTYFYRLSYSELVDIEKNIRVISFTIKIEILLEPTSNKHMVASDTLIDFRIDFSIQSVRLRLAGSLIPCCLLWDALVMRTASAAAKPCQRDSLEFYLITGSTPDDWRS